MKEKFGSKILEWLMVLIMSIIIVVTVTGVVARYVFIDPLYWTDELNLTLFVWLIFIGIAVAVKNQENMRIDFFTSLLPKKLQNIILFLSET